MLEAWIQVNKDDLAESSVSSILYVLFQQIGVKNVVLIQGCLSADAGGNPNKVYSIQAGAG